MATDKLVDFDHVTDYIIREAAYSIFKNSCDECKDFCLEFDGIYPDCDSCMMGKAKRQMLDIPAADVRPVVHGKWKKRMEEKETPYYKSFTPIWSCSECGTEYDPSLCMTINFCPNCGADCRGGNDGK